MDPEFHVSSATFSYSFRNFSQITKLTSSPACWIQNLPWKIYIEPIIQVGKKYLSVYVGCTESGRDHWSCSAVVEVYKLYGVTPKIIRANTSLIFDSAVSTSWGHEQFMHWDEVLNPANGFIKDEAVTIEVTIRAEIPDGLKLTPDHYTDERANIAYKIWKQEKYILETEIHNLKTLNEKNKNEIIASIQSIDDLKEQLKKNNNLVEQLDDCRKNLETEHGKLQELQDKSKECEANLKTEKEKVEKLVKEETDSKSENGNLQKKIILVTKQLEEGCKNFTQSNDSNKICDVKLKTIEIENSDLKKQLSSIESELNNSNLRIKNLIEDHSNQIKTLEVERDNLKTNLEKISKEFELGQKKIDSLKLSCSEESDEANKQKESLSKTIQNLTDQIKNLNTVINDLKTENDKMKAQVTNLQLQLNKSTETQTSVNIETKQNEIDKLKTENQNLTNQMKLGYEKYSKLKSEKDDVDSRLKVMNVDSSKAREEVDQLKKNFIATQKDLSECKETLQKMKTENNDLNLKLLSSNNELEEIKNELTRSEVNSNELKNLKDNCEKLKLEITSLTNSLMESKNEIQRMRNKFQKRTTYDENTNLKIDLNNENISKQEQDLRNSKLNTDSVSEKLAELEGKYKIVIDARNKLKCEMENLRKKFEKVNKDAVETSQQENKNITNKLNDLQFKLDEERNEKLRILDGKKEVDDELNELKQESEAQIKTKNTLLIQVRECHQLSKEVFWLIIELVKLKKSQDEMPCLIETRLKVIMEILSKNKRRAYLRSTKADTVLNQPPSTQISTDILQKKLGDLEIQLEKEIEIVSTELKSEQNKRLKLMLSNTKLSILLENEIFMTDQYKKLAKNSESRAEDIENRLNDSNNQLFTERNKRFRYEEDIHRMSMRMKTIEIQTDRMKKNIWKQAIEVCDECSCSYSKEFAANSKLTDGPAADSTDAKTSIASCDSGTSTNEKPVHNAPTEQTPNTTEAISTQAEDKKDEPIEKTQAAKIPGSNPITLANINL